MTGPASTHPHRVKVLDFGLAKSTAASDADVTRVTRHTNPGTIVGTVSYMSPEQARGDAHLTIQSDQFSLGLILYQLATGKRPFQRSSAAETMTAIIRDDAEALPASVPLPLRWVIERLLSKNPADRYDSTRDLYRELRQIRGRMSEATVAPAAVATRPRRRLSARAIAIAAGLLALGALAALLAIRFALQRAPSPGADLAALTITPFSRFDADERFPTWSPDGRTIAFSMRVQAVFQVFTKAVEGQDAAQLTRTPDHCLVAFWSTDGTTIYYRSNDQLWAVAASGGMPQSVLKDVQYVAVHPDGRTLAFVRGGRLFTDALGGSNPRPVGDSPFPQGQVVGPRFSRDGSRLAVQSAGQMWIVPFPSGPPRALLPGPSMAWNWLPDNRHLLVASPSMDGQLKLSRLDIESGTSEMVFRAFGPATEFDVSPDGRRLALARGEAGWNVFEVSIPSGAARPFLSGSGVISWLPDWSPAGNRYVVSTNRSGPMAIEDVSAQDGFSRRLATADPGETFSYARWSTDGSRVAYSHLSDDGTRLMVTNVAGGRPTPFGPVIAGFHAVSPSWSPDSQWVSYIHTTPTDRSVMKIQVAAAAMPIVLAKMESTWLDYPVTVWSPAGDWIAYPNADGIRLVTPDGKNNRLLTSRRPVVFGFTRDGRRLYGVARGDASTGRRWELLKIDVASGRDRLVSPIQLSDGIPSLAGFTLHPDGTRFLISAPIWPFDIWLIDGLEPPRRPLPWLLGN